MTQSLVFDEPVVRAEHKGFPDWAVGRLVSESYGMLRLAGGDMPTPVVLVRKDALEHNLSAMRAFCDTAGMSLSPHVKTTMSPEIIAAQLAHGGWAVTVATPTQLRTVRALGVNRALLANQLVDPAAIEWLGRVLDEAPDFTAYCYVDSLDGAHLLEEALASRGQRRPLPVLVELGVDAGRTGARSVGDVVRLAKTVHASPWLRLAGVGGFEGIIGGPDDPGSLTVVEAYLRELRTCADEVLAFATERSEELVVTAGGSAYVELVRDVLDARWRGDRPIRVVLRSGCYVTHDSFGYEDFRRLMAHCRERLTLQPAIELWGRVLSRPEADLALLDFGKRDVGVDAGFPRPLYLLRRGGVIVEPAPAGEIVALNDQHAYLRGAAELRVGDLVGFGIAHPCTTFDKWRLMPVVDADRTVVGAVHTLF